jgi:mono/diheme cytochrome c family protein
MRTRLLLFGPLALLGCGGGSASPEDLALPDLAPSTPPGYTAISAEPQRTGDAQAGYAALVNKGYVSCGMPYSLYAQFFGAAPAAQRLPGRDGDNAALPYFFTAFTAASGVEVVGLNCLTCHAGSINGKLVVGLGDAARDFTIDASAAADLAAGFVTGAADVAEYQKWAGRVDAIGPYTVTPVVGVNPADNLAAVLFAHRDPQTLAWSDTPLLELPPRQVVPVDVPPWWRMKKKNAMFYNAAGRGDHARIMMTASTLCTDSVAEAQAIDAYFPDVEAYITSLSPPPYPFPVDAALAGRGGAVFATSCAGCHGSYGDGGSYPNLLIATDLVGTDPTLAVGASQFADRFVGWFNASFYGQRARLEPQNGYVAPPLDGIWATAPYLHNGSVPTIAALLDSTSRPKFWTRTFDSTDYDPAALGWHFQSLDHGQSAETDASVRKRLYDTTLPGYSNAGHTFGDALSADDRLALIEYLKTL